jgi:hypothetical protein
MGLGGHLGWKPGFSKGATQGPFHQNLAAIGPVVSEEKIKMWNVAERTMDEKW